ncbi:MAG TPA: C2H2-type zinc finger protein, partial [Candidatus Lokiarchaeia archaeon]|nr:C2H2-type zinc finger protein [Candidatus Lokiarchaeia archaeon]
EDDYDDDEEYVYDGRRVEWSSFGHPAQSSYDEEIANNKRVIHSTWAGNGYGNKNLKLVLKRSWAVRWFHLIPPGEGSSDRTTFGRKWPSTLRLNPGHMSLDFDTNQIKISAQVLSAEDWAPITAQLAATLQVEMQIRQKNVATFKDADFWRATLKLIPPNLEGFSIECSCGEGSENKFCDHLRQAWIWLAVQFQEDPLQLYVFRGYSHAELLIAIQETRAAAAGQLLPLELAPLGNPEVPKEAAESDLATFWQFPTSLPLPSSVPEKTTAPNQFITNLEVQTMAVEGMDFVPILADAFQKAAKSAAKEFDTIAQLLEANATVLQESVVDQGSRSSQMENVPDGGHSEGASEVSPPVPPSPPIVVPLPTEFSAREFPQNQKKGRGKLPVTASVILTLTKAKSKQFPAANTKRSSPLKPKKAQRPLPSRKVSIIKPTRPKKPIAVAKPSASPRNASLAAITPHSQDLYQKSNQSTTESGLQRLKIRSPNELQTNAAVDVAYHFRLYDKTGNPMRVFELPAWGTGSDMVLAVLGKVVGAARESYEFFSWPKKAGKIPPESAILNHFFTRTGDCWSLKSELGTFYIQLYQIIRKDSSPDLPKVAAKKSDKLLSQPVLPNADVIPPREPTTDQKVIEASVEKSATKSRNPKNKCPYCNRSFGNKGNMKIHVNSCKKKVTNPQATSITSHACPHCGRSFTNAGLMKRHANSCRKKQKSQPKVVPPAEENKCPHCGRLFTNKGNMKAHLNSCKKQVTFSQAMSVTSRTCPHCGRTFLNRGNLKIHIKACRRTARTTTAPQSVAQRSPSHRLNKKVCPHCGRHFRNTGAMGRHAKTCKEVVQSSSLLCPHCQRVFKNTSNLNKHIKACKQQQVPSILPSTQDGRASSINTCPRCGRTLSNTSHLNRHLKVCKKKKLPVTLHPGTRCPHCGRNFTNAGTMKTHAKACGKKQAPASMPTTPRLSANVQFKCTKCGQILASEKNFKRHLRSCKKRKSPQVTNVKVQCTRCGREISKGGALKQHLKSCKKNSNAKAISLRKAGAADTLLPKTHECPHCGREFSNIGNMRKHADACLRHMQKPVAMKVDHKHCPFCGRYFKNSRSLKYHVTRCPQRGKSNPSPSKPTEVPLYQPIEVLEHLAAPTEIVLPFQEMLSVNPQLLSNTTQNTSLANSREPQSVSTMEREDLTPPVDDVQAEQKYLFKLFDQTGKVLRTVETPLAASQLDLAKCILGSEEVKELGSYAFHAWPQNRLEPAPGDLPISAMFSSVGDSWLFRADALNNVVQLWKIVRNSPDLN